MPSLGRKTYPHVEAEIIDQVQRVNAELIDLEYKLEKAESEAAELRRAIHRTQGFNPVYREDMDMANSLHSEIRSFQTAIERIHTRFKHHFDLSDHGYSTVGSRSKRR